MHPEHSEADDASLSSEVRRLASGIADQMSMGKSGPEAIGAVIDYGTLSHTATDQFKIAALIKADSALFCQLLDGKLASVEDPEVRKYVRAILTGRYERLWGQKK